MTKWQSARQSTWLPNAILACLVGFVCGAVCVPVINRLVYGDLDPFIHGWPLLLEVSAFLLPGIITLTTGHAITAALGLYGGLIVTMLTLGNPEYPVASIVALAVHGFIPALLGGALGAWIRSSRQVTDRDGVEAD